MNELLSRLNGEDMILLFLLLWLLMNRKKENAEVLIGLGFLFYIGLRERGEKRCLTEESEGDALFS